MGWSWRARATPGAGGRRIGYSAAAAGRRDDTPGVAAAAVLVAVVQEGTTVEWMVVASRPPAAAAVQERSGKQRTLPAAAVAGAAGRSGEAEEAREGDLEGGCWARSRERQTAAVEGQPGLVGTAPVAGRTWMDPAAGAAAAVAEEEGQRSWRSGTVGVERWAPHRGGGTV